jgi:hypothetical protein
LQEALKSANLQPFLNPYDPSLELNPPSCPRVMDSKKLPLWLTFKNAKTNEDIDIIFKAGDDLRQDMLTLQLIRVMDDMWLEQGLDLKMSAYECISTGDEVGMLQVVTNSKTIAQIQKKVTALKKDDVLFDWLVAQSKGDQAALTLACDHFLLSCAGYVCAYFACDYPLHFVCRLRVCVCVCVCVCPFVHH